MLKKISITHLYVYRNTRQMSIYKLDWYTLMYNEADIIPYVVDYWQKLRDSGIDLHVYIYDNYSTDNSV